MCTKIRVGVVLALAILIRAVRRSVELGKHNATKQEDVDTKSEISKILDEVQSKIIADPHNTFLECRGIERTMKERWEAAKVALEAAETPCAVKTSSCENTSSSEKASSSEKTSSSENKPFSEQLGVENLLLECIAGSCDGPLSELKKRVEDLRPTLGEDVIAEVVAFTEGCNAAKDTIAAAKQNETELGDAYDKQKGQCEDKKRFFHGGAVPDTSVPDNFVGCFIDEHQRDLEYSQGTDPNVESCAAKCAGFKYMGQQAWGECRCGNDLSYPQASSDCACTQGWHGLWRNCVYQLA